MNRQAPRISVGLFLPLWVVTACSPSVQVNHRDPTHQSVDIFIDNDTSKTLDYGDDESISVSEGAHVITALPVGEKASPWTEDGKGWTIWVEKEAILTLLPPTGAGVNE